MVVSWWAAWNKIVARRKKNEEWNENQKRKKAKKEKKRKEKESKTKR